MFQSNCFDQNLPNIEDELFLTWFFFLYLDHCDGGQDMEVKEWCKSRWRARAYRAVLLPPPHDIARAKTAQVECGTRRRVTRWVHTYLSTLFGRYLRPLLYLSPPELYSFNGRLFWGALWFRHVDNGDHLWERCECLVSATYCEAWGIGAKQWKMDDDDDDVDVAKTWKGVNRHRPRFSVTGCWS